MPILTIPVAVPVAGDGPIASISTLVGAKTVTFAGHFTGSFTLLASHDDANFVPVLLFDADGIEGIEQILEGSVKSVRLRANGNPVVGSPLSCEVSAVAVVGQNKFATVASLLPGTTGPSAAIDTTALFPPTGLEQDINFACAGAFVGAIVVEGSPDNSDWNPICTFRAGQVGARPLVGTLPRLEFSPILTLDKIRYLRVNVSGQVTGATVVTVGGGIPLSTTPGTDSISPVEDSTARSTTLNAIGEEILYEEPMDLDAVAIGAPITPQWSAVIAVSLASTGTFQLYIGATTPGNTAGGTVRAILTTSSLTAALASVAGAAFANPGGKVLVQIAGINNTPATCVSKMLSFTLRMV